ncbi:MAG: rhodanese-like domain-containing protein, partial [Nitrospinaceae bacterium]|nr:rhodanese-like domain-containing protein [Nitrospinaceae bacterium]NIR55665.1 rhodanese-like domain-containing protein [Nitrospinaceae bacterium]NIS86109.1 rhodanese-like domain-containing protein [Nitrospinaceae bacterium]NIT82953.1 rhodanese-like domain-containing protein [Nitrospinaceae bacterium]NIU45156.1 rhodanese-like domain-containing protein [Nitrospinaceae bacterium]
METITVEEFYQRIQSLGEEDLVLDVRSPGEFKEGHIRGARNHPHEEVAAIADELQNYKTVYVHCKMGGRAKIASQAL